LGTIAIHCLQTFQPKIFGSKLENRKSGIIHKVPVGTFGLYTNGQFTAKNIRFKIRKIEILVLFIKSWVGNQENIGTDTFQPKIFGSKLEKIIIVEYHHQWRPFIRGSISQWRGPLDDDSDAPYATIRNISITCPKRG
jgi:hypothetical protein